MNFGSVGMPGRVGGGDGVMVAEAEDRKEGRIAVILQFYLKLSVERVIKICHGTILQMLPLLLDKSDDHFQRMRFQQHVDHLTFNK